jgi:predicted transcriptional regulator
MHIYGNNGEKEKRAHVGFPVVGAVNRDRHEIVMEILRKAALGRKKTVLIADVGLSYVQAKQYLTTLFEKGLLEIDKKNLLKTTKKGLELVEKCDRCVLYRWKKQNKKPASNA